ncbi:polygalacturonase-like [Phalaenopsis equestris]|uniref:polygalacturonase-like n=1 Tax=Phalaenopsis equestris TaxID=78828 RepID=UPI0009E2EF59|nr:polygalacturonase-like [Phalaenopsis equestris]
MAPQLITSLLLLLLLPLFFFPPSSANQTYNIVDYGGHAGRQALLNGPCRNNHIHIHIKGTIVAPSSYTSNEQWIMFKNVNGLTISGGLFDGRGQALWSCKTNSNNHNSCPNGSTSLTFAYCNNVRLNRLRSVNSEQFHISIYRSSNVKVRYITVSAPFNSPNTDGIHIEGSTNVAVLGCRIATGDDCISMGPGDTNIWIENIRCGPGHGISIGSLGYKNGQDGVQNVTVKNIHFTGTQNGFRIKTWAKPNNGFAQQILFHNASMNNVKNPIIIDQYYCPDHYNCPTESSGVQISDVTFRDVWGSSATETAVTLECSESRPCKGIVLQNIKLGYNGDGEVKMLCSNVHGRSSGLVIPPCCISE